MKFKSISNHGRKTGLIGGVIVGMVVANGCRKVEGIGSILTVRISE